MTTEPLSSRLRPANRTEPEWVVLVMVLALLAIGLFARNTVLSRTSGFDQGGISLRYPAEWSNQARLNDFETLRAGEPLEIGPFPASLAVQQMAATEVSRSAESLGDLALAWADRASQELLGYRVLEIEPLQVGGVDAVRLDYAYVAEPALGTARVTPVVALGEDLLFRQGDQLSVVSFNAASEDFATLNPTWKRIIASLRLK